MNASLRAGLAGAATGMRSQSALAAFELTAPNAHPVRRALTAAGAATELVLDKLARTPSRVSPAGLVPRLALGGVTAWLLAGRGGANRLGAAVVGTAAAGAASVGGARARAALSGRLGSDLPGALAEDAVALTLAGLAARPG
jgi:uncharacterized membrane protein